MKYHGRRKPYTQIGISRVPCVRCNKPSVHQWQVCANDNRYLGLCLDCDIALNKLALQFARIPNWSALLKAYKEANK